MSLFVGSVSFFNFSAVELFLKEKCSPNGASNKLKVLLLESNSPISLEFEIKSISFSFKGLTFTFIISLRDFKSILFPLKAFT